MQNGLDVWKGFDPDRRWLPASVLPYSAGRKTSQGNAARRACRLETWDTNRNLHINYDRSWARRWWRYHLGSWRHLAILNKTPEASDRSGVLR